MPDNWTESRIAMLRNMWKAGHTASQISDALGGMITRNAVVGKAHRLGLAGRPDPIIRTGERPTPKRKLHRFQKTKHTKLQPVPISVAVAEPPVYIPKARSETHGCRFPIGDPRARGFHYCLVVPVISGTPYCAEHCSVAYQRPVAEHRPVGAL